MSSNPKVTPCNKSLLMRQQSLS